MDNKDKVIRGNLNRDSEDTPDITPDFIPGPDFDWYTYHGNVQDDAEMYQ
jgi:hypothetical protein